MFISDAIYISGVSSVAPDTVIDLLLSLDPSACYSRKPHRTSKQQQSSANL
jgi:hypothetical protein